MVVPLRTALTLTMATSFSALLPGCVSSEQLAIDRAVRARGQIATYACSENSGCMKESDDRREE
jgi:hypothetical protein